MDGSDPCDQCNSCKNSCRDDESYELSGTQECLKRVNLKKGERKKKDDRKKSDMRERIEG